MNTTIKTICFAFIAMLSGISVGACSDDDEMTNIEDKIKNSSIVMLNSNFKLKKIECNNSYSSELKFSDSSLEEYTTHIPLSGYLYEGTWPSSDIKVTYNANGTISRLSNETSDEKYSYNSNKQLIRITETGYFRHYVWNRTTFFSYSNGVLKEINYEFYDNEGKFFTSKDVFEYDQNAPNNTYLQWVPISCFHMYNKITGLACAGLLGNGPTKLPTRIIEYDSDDLNASLYCRDYSKTTNQCEIEYKYSFNGSNAVTAIKETRHDCSEDASYNLYYTE